MRIWTGSKESQAMKSSIALTVAALTVWAGCAPDPVKNGACTSGYFQQAMGLLDTGNPMPPISASAVGERGTNELCGIKTGMAMADVISAWGKPRALGINCAGRASLLFGQFGLSFDGDRLTKIWPNAQGKRKPHVGPVTTNFVPHSFALAYYENLNSLFRTNSLDHALRALKTNSVISVAKLKDGEIGGLKLGMTMSEVVAVRGKPRYFCRFSADRAILYGIGTFRGDCLWSFSVDVPEGSQGMSFDNGLALTNSISEYVKAFGRPLWLSRSGLLYKFCKGYVEFSFYVKDDEPSSGNARDHAVLNGISLHFRGVRDVCDEADARFVVGVAEITGIERGKVQSLIGAESAVDLMTKLENEMGKPLTEKQRKQVSLATEKKELEIKKAYEDDKE